MRAKLSLFFVTVFAIALFTPNLAGAQNPGDAFSKYTNPHEICKYYRTHTSFAIVRISDNECLVSLGTGKYKTFTQYYYSKNNWCYKLIQEGRTVHSNCVPRPDKAIDIEEFAPYIIGVVVLVVVLVVVSSAKPPVSPAAQLPGESANSFRRGKSVPSKKPRPKKRGRIWREQKLKK